jgi:hypothetical protein
MERRALYNSLRMSWQLDSQIAVQPWQVENYRNLSFDELFNRFQNYRINIDRMTFLQLAENCDSPEELADLLMQEEEQEDNYDKIYLIVFELWRRLIPEKQSLSIFCDELDYQIALYDTGQAETSEGIQDALANLQILLDENADKGVNGKNLFASISQGCANDIEDFLYDFTQVQVEHQNYLYAQELIEGFSPYVSDQKWFALLQAEILYATDRDGSIKLIESLIKKKDQELEFNFEVLAFLAKSGDEKLFKSLAKQTFALLELEEDFIDLANICADYFHYSDNDKNELAIQQFLTTREHKPSDAPFAQNDVHAKELLKILNS